MTDHPSSRGNGNQWVFTVLLLGIGSVFLGIGVLTVVGFWTYKQVQLQAERQLIVARQSAEEAKLQEEVAAQTQIIEDKQQARNDAQAVKTMTAAQILASCKAAEELRKQALAAAAEQRQDEAEQQFSAAQQMIDRYLGMAPDHPDLREQKLLNILAQAEYRSGIAPEREVSFEERWRAQQLAGEAVTLLQSKRPITNRDQYLLRIKQVEFITAPEIAPAPRVKR